MDKHGNKTGGRQKGVVNRDKQQLRDAITEELRRQGLVGKTEEFDIVCFMAAIAVKAAQPGDEQDLHLAIKAASEVARYVRPQLRSIVMHAEIEERKEVSMKDVQDAFFGQIGLIEDPEQKAVQRTFYEKAGVAHLIEGTATEVEAPPLVQ